MKILSSEFNLDERGWFGRVFDHGLVAGAGIPTSFPHHNLSWNRAAGTIRGLHFQTTPGEESKVIRCLTGALYDVVVDMRRDSPTFQSWEAFELTDPSKAVFIPAGYAHGFQTLENDTLVLYLMGDVYRPEQQRGVRFDDPVLGIEWPRSERIMSDADAARLPYDWSRNWTEA